MTNEEYYITQDDEMTAKKLAFAEKLENSDDELPCAAQIACCSDCARVQSVYSMLEAGTPRPICWRDEDGQLTKMYPPGTDWDWLIAACNETPIPLRKSPYTVKGRVRYDLLGRDLIAAGRIFRHEGNLYSFDGKAYRAGTRQIKLLMEWYVSGLLERDREELLSYIDLKAPEEKWLSEPTRILFTNGILDIETDNFSPSTPADRILNQVPWPYCPDDECPLVDRFLDAVSCGDPAVRALLEECAGICLYRDNMRFKRAFLLLGDRNNGKSTYLSMLQTALGGENVSNVSLEQLGDRFKLAELAGKLANIGDDISGEYLSDVSYFKKLVSGDSLTAERKYQEPFSFASYAKLIFSSNEMPHMRDPGGAAMSRFIIVPFNATFAPDSPACDPEVRRALMRGDAARYFLVLAVRGLTRVLEQGFTKCERADAAHVDYEMENDVVLRFLSENFGGEDGHIPATNLAMRTVGEVYQTFSDYCRKNGHRDIITQDTCTKRILKHVGGLTVKRMTLNGSRARYFTLEQKPDGSECDHE